MLRITGGTVYDPANHVHGDVRDVRDVCIADGKVVADVVRAERTRGTMADRACRVRSQS